MKHLTIKISEEEARVLGINKNTFSIDEFLSMLNTKLKEDSLEGVKEPLEDYGITGKTKGNFDLMVRKIRLINRIGRIENDVLLRNLEKLISGIEFAEGEASEVIKPMKKNFSVSDMIEQQNFEGVDRELIDKLTEEMDVREPLEQLLKSV